MLVFNRAALRPGMIVSVRTSSVFGNLISKILTPAFDNLGPAAKKYVPECPSHDAIIVEVGGELMIGDAAPLFCHPTPLEEYEKCFESGKYRNPVVWGVAGITTDLEEQAADWWMHYVNGTMYDFMAFPRLFIKATVADLINTVAGWEWANWCTEGVANAYKYGANFDCYGKLNPTPLTTIKRAVIGVLKPQANALFDLPDRG